MTQTATNAVYIVRVKNAAANQLLAELAAKGAIELQENVSDEEHPVPKKVQEEMLRRKAYGIAHPETRVPLEVAMKNLRVGK